MLSGKTYAGQDVHRRDLRRRPDGRGRRRLSRRPRGQQRSTARSGTACRPACCITGITSASLKEKISPYVVPGDPKSGVLPRISTEPPGEYGEGDKRVQAYCFRMCLTDHPENRIPFPKPEGYDPKQYELLAAHLRRRLARDVREVRPDPQPQDRHQQPRPVQHRQHRHQLRLSRGHRTSAAARSSRSTRPIRRAGSTSSPTTRACPKDVQEEMQKWGLPKDEFKDNGNWPHQIYVREARRMIGELRDDRERAAEEAADAGLGRHGLATRIDSHNVQRYITPEGYVQNEGDIGVAAERPVRDRLRLARAEDAASADNLLVPVCVSQLAHRLRLDPHGAGLHDPRPVRRDGRGAGDRRAASPCRTCRTRSCASGC